MMKQYLKNIGMYIDGKWEFDSGRKTFPVYYAYTGELIGELPEANEEDLERIASAAQAAFDRHELSDNDRSAILAKAAGNLKANRENIVKILVLEVGKTYKEANSELDSAITVFEMASNAAKNITGKQFPINNQPNANLKKFGLIIKKPAGPVCAISAYNAPINQGAHKVASAIAAGCPVLLKPSPYTPYSAMALMQALEDAGLPHGWAQLIFGGAEISREMIKNQTFKRFLFTGSYKIGKDIATNADMRPVILEMGSNAPNIIHKDADIESALSACMCGFTIAGQVCTSVQRLYVHEDIVDKVTARYLEKIQALKVGDPMNPETDMGPVRNLADALRFDAVIAEAVKGGAKILTGGHRKDLLIEPTLLTNVNASMSVVHDEMFLPLVCIIPYSDFDSALEQANDSMYGLQAGVFTTDLNLAVKAIKTLNYGGIMINDASRCRLPQMNYGGVKASGIGREGMPCTLDFLMDEINVVINTAF